MNVRSQPAEMERRKAAKPPRAGAQMSRSTSAFRTQLSELCGAFTAASMEQSTGLGNKNITQILPCYTRESLTRKPTEINKLLPDLHRDNRDEKLGLP